MGRSAARFHTKICSIFAQNGFEVIGVCRRDPIRIEHVEDFPSVGHGAGFSRIAAAASESRSTTRLSRNLSIASYATISGSGNLVTFETQGQ
jgi:hypothetical protein